MRHPMRLLTIISFLLLWTSSYSQNNEIFKLVFSDKSNFDITTLLDNKRPTVYYVLSTTDGWNTYRFHLDEDLTSEIVRKRLERDEHSPYNHSYIFRDTVVDKFFDARQKDYLYWKAQSIKPRKLADTFKMFKLIKSFKAAKNGFFFSVSDPIFTVGNSYWEK